MNPWRTVRMPCMHPILGRSVTVPREMHPVTQFKKCGIIVKIGPYTTMKSGVGWVRKDFSILFYSYVLNHCQVNRIIKSCWCFENKAAG